MAMLRNEFTAALLRQGTEIFWDAYDAMPDVWTGLFTEKTISGAYVDSTSMAGMGDLVEKKENEPLTYETPADGWPFFGTVKTYGKALAWSMELYEDNTIQGLFEQQVREWAEGYKRTRDRYYVRFFNEGALLNGSPVFDQTIPGVRVDPNGGKIYDGKPFFAAAADPHPARHCSMVGVNYAPLPLTMDNLIDVYKTMTLPAKNAHDELGNEIIIQPDTLLIPPSLRFTAMQILAAEYLPHTATTPSIPNPLRSLNLALIEWPRLSDADGWFLLQRGKGLRALNRKMPAVDVWIDQETKQVKASVIARWGGYVDNWRYTFACNIPQS